MIPVIVPDLSQNNIYHGIVISCNSVTEAIALDEASTRYMDGEASHTDIQLIKNAIELQAKLDEQRSF